MNLTDSSKSNSSLNAATAETVRQSEAKYRNLFEAIDQDFCVVELLYDQQGKAVDYRFEEVNSVFEQQTGYLEAKDKRATQLAPNVSQAWIDLVDSVARTGKPIRTEAFFDDPARWYTISMSRLGGASSPRVVSVFDDITHRKRDEQQQAYRLVLSDALRSIADPVAIEETVTHIAIQQFAADRCYYCRLQDGQAIITRDAVRGDLPSVAGTYPLNSFALLKAVVDAGQPFAVDDATTTLILDEQIRAICVQMQIISFLNVPVIKQGQAVGILCTVQSTPRHWTQDEIQLAIETAERTWAAVERASAEKALNEANRRKDEFLAMLAHELRNPMATIRSGLTILDLTLSDQTPRSTVAMMSRQTEHLVRLVDDLLDVSRISQGKIELKKQRVNLVEIVSQVVESVGTLYQQQARSLQVALPTQPIYLEGDATRLSQVVTNLLTNGARYTDQQGQVWLSLSHKRQEAILEVGDNGIGLAADQLSAIFELFVQVDNSTARSKGGLGLGLTLVKRLVEMHGGRVEAQSAGLGQGSTFTVHLPSLETAPEAELKPIDETPSQRPSTRILIIDDNADAALTLAMLLKLKGYEAHTRTSGRAGLEAAEALKPGAIVLDIGMPELDGYATCRLLREQPWGQFMPVIALSSYGQDEDRQRANEAGFTAHLVKPVDLDALLSLLVKSLSNPKAD